MSERYEFVEGYPHYYIAFALIGRVVLFTRRVMRSP